MSTARADEWVLAHLSDPHLTQVAGLKVRDLLTKRLLGYLSWRRRRRHLHRPEVLDALIADLHALAPDHIAITGDLTHLGTSSELEEAAAWLGRVGSPRQVTLVPGNHDAYRPGSLNGALTRWAPYMRSDGMGEDPVTDPSGFFPSLRVRDGVALIGVNTGVPTNALLATGRIGPGQLQGLGRVLHETGRAGLYRVLLLHHPPAPGIIQWRKRLTDAPALVALIAAEGVELVVHGHGHHGSLSWVAIPGGRAPVVGVRSASELTERPGRLAQYHIFRIRHRWAERRLTLSVRQYAPPTGGFVAEGNEQPIL